MSSPVPVGTKTTHRIDASGKVLGRLATEIATFLRGKHKVGFTKHEDSGDEVIVLNPGKIIVTGKKLTDKKYYRHSTYPGALKEESLAHLMERDAGRVIFLAVRNMLPDNRLRTVWLKRLKFEDTDAKN